MANLEAKATSLPPKVPYTTHKLIHQSASIPKVDFPDLSLIDKFTSLGLSYPEILDDGI
jgi:hypothetical protein